MSNFTVTQLMDMYEGFKRRTEVKLPVADYSPIGMSEMSEIDSFIADIPEIKVEHDPGYTFEDR